MHEADRGAALDHVDQHVSEAFDLGIADGVQPAHLHSRHDVTPASR